MTVEGVCIFMRDTYDFVNRTVFDQWLGRWDCENERWADENNPRNEVYNSHFQDYRTRTGQGGDFELYSPLRELALSQTYLMVCE